MYIIYILLLFLYKALCPAAVVTQCLHIARKILVTFAIAKFADFSKPFLAAFLFLSLEFCQIWKSCYFCDICCSVFLGRKKKSLLLLRFLRNLRTSQSPSWPFLFLSLEFCQIWISWYSCDIVFTGSNKKSFLRLLRFLRNLLHFWYQFPLFFIFFFDKIAQTIC